jgi:hypothetical protein
LVFEILVFRLAQPSLPTQGQIQFSENGKSLSSENFHHEKFLLAGFGF